MFEGLSAVFVKNVKDPGKYHDGGGMGLYLRVEAKRNGKFWIQRYTFNGKRRETGLGSPPVVTLAMAREQAIEHKRMIRKGLDPIEEKQKLRKREETITFSQAMEAYLAVKLDEFRSDKHRKQWRATLDNYAIPIIGTQNVATLETQDILKVLEPIWAEKTETASRLRGRIEAVLSWAAVSGHRRSENPARWKGNLSELLAKPSKVKAAGNFPALQLADAQRWWADLSDRGGMAAEALRFACMTASRSGEVRGMVWAEVDLDKCLWIIPATRMKTQREHREP